MVIPLYLREYLSEPALEDHVVGKETNKPVTLLRGDSTVGAETCENCTERDHGLVARKPNLKNMRGYERLNWLMIH